MWTVNDIVVDTFPFIILVDLYILLTIADLQKKVSNFQTEFSILDHCVLGEVLFSLIPLLIFIIFVLYAFCRMGVFAVCNPMRMCPNSPDTQVDLPSITPKKLLNYKRGLVAKKNQALAAFQQASGSPGDRPPDPDSGDTGGIAIPGKFPDTFLKVS